MRKIKKTKSIRLPPRITKNTFTAIYIKLPDGWYMGMVEEWPNIVTQGKNLREVRFMVKDAIKLMTRYNREEFFKNLKEDKIKVSEIIREKVIC